MVVSAQDKADVVHRTRTITQILKHSGGRSGRFETKTENGVGWHPADFRGEYVYLLENNDVINLRDADQYVCKPITVVKRFQIECPSIIFVRLRDDNAEVYNFVKFVSNIKEGIQSQCFVHSKYAGQSRPDQ